MDGWPAELSTRSSAEMARFRFDLPTARNFRTFEEAFRAILEPLAPAPLGRVWLPSPEVRLGKAAGQAVRALLLGARGGVPHFERAPLQSPLQEIASFLERKWGPRLGRIRRWPPDTLPSEIEFALQRLRRVPIRTLANLEKGYLLEN